MGRFVNPILYRETVYLHKLDDAGFTEIQVSILLL